MDNKQKDKDFYTGLKSIAYFTQFGISSVAPVVLISILGNWLTKQYSWPNWVMIIFVFFGLGCTIVSFINGLKTFIKITEASSTKIKKQDEDENDKNKIK